jgi:AraC-like DNA-binding protein
MAIPIPLSSKLAVTADQGYFLRQSSQPNYHFDWHMHDCAMLLWPQVGALDSRWTAEPGTAPQALQLVRNTALLLPASAAHSTRSHAHRQRHGELYLRPELLGRTRSYGVFRLDAAAVAMLDALAAPALAPAGGEPLVQALMAQLAARQPAQGLHADGTDRTESVPQRMLKCYARALDLETPMPTVQAVADELGVSVRCLQRTCAAELGSSPVTVRRLLLASKARELMAKGLSPARVSPHLGFTHSGHLNRLLRDVQA